MVVSDMNNANKGLRVSIEHIGPIKSLDLPLNDISMILGRPNSGKSYTLRSIYWFLLNLDEKAMVRMVEKYSSSYDMELDEPESTDLNRFSSSVIEYSIRILRALLSRYSSNKVKEREESTSYSQELKTKILQDKFELNLRIPREELKANISEMYAKELVKFVGSSNTRNITINGTGFHEVLRRAINSVLPEKGHIISGRDYYFLLPEIYQMSDNSVAYTVRRLNRDFPIILNFDSQIVGVGTDQVRLSISVSAHFDLEKVQILFRRRYFSGMMARPLEKYLLDLEKSLDENPKAVLSDSNLHILESITKEYSDFIMQLSFNEVGNELYNLTSLKSVKFIPYGRNLLMELANTSFGNAYYESGEIIEILKGLESTPLTNYFEWVLESRKLINSAPSEFTELFELIIAGKLSYIEDTGALVYNYTKDKMIKLGLSSAMVEELSGLLLPLLSSSESELILIEEPEAQLHVSTQILMGLLLIAIAVQKKLKIVISTHSDLLALVVHYVLDLRPDEESLSSLIKEIIPYGKTEDSQISWLAKTVSKMDKSTGSVSCFIESNGKSRILESEELDTSIPSISSTVDSFYKWTISELLKKQDEAKGHGGDSSAKADNL